jgi:two-component system, OmpR family, phosphate regulon sensor histidine kinase PhoR
MDTNIDSDEARSGRPGESLLARGFAAGRWVPVGAAAATLLMLVLAGRLDIVWALFGAIAIVAATLAIPIEPVGDNDKAPARPRAPLLPATVAPAEPQSWRAIVDAIPDGAVALDAAGAVLHHNAIARELFPRIRTGQPLSRVLRFPELIEAIDRAPRASEPATVELLERVPVARRVAATVSRLPAGAAMPGSPAALVTFRDLTEQDQLAQMRADFVANASHELRTPLASLRGFVETLQGPARDDAAARERFLAIMASQAERMTRLIDDLLSLSRVEMRAHLPPRGIVELNETAAYVLQVLEPLAERSGTRLELTPLDGPARIQGDREEIVQVLQNLVHNSIKYGREGGHVEIAIGREDGRLALAVSDDGPGIAPEHLPRLTERFYRVSIASSREKGGTGLGLAIVKHVLARHRADLRIASRVGEGSTFTAVFEELR